MTAFIAEARRLGIEVPLSIPMSESTREFTSGPYDNEGLCVQGCYTCRSFRNTVREALAAEEAEFAQQDALLAEVERLAAFDDEELHAIEAATEFENHLALLPPTRLQGLAMEALNHAIGLAHMAFDEAFSNGGELVEPESSWDVMFADLFAEPLDPWDEDEDDYLDSADEYDDPYWYLG